MHKSIATINSPEFINLAPLDINPLMSSCEIKVLYIGENRNHTYISKEVATDIAKTPARSSAPSPSGLHIIPLYLS